jgi:hypothetical protein
MTACAHRAISPVVGSRHVSRSQPPSRYPLPTSIPRKIPSCPPIDWAVVAASFRVLQVVGSLLFAWRPGDRYGTVFIQFLPLTPAYIVRSEAKAPNECRLSSYIGRSERRDVVFQTEKIMESADRSGVAGFGAL